MQQPVESVPFCFQVQHSESLGELYVMNNQLVVIHQIYLLEADGVCGLR